MFCPRCGTPLPEWGGCKKCGEPRPVLHRPGPGRRFPESGDGGPGAGEAVGCGFGGVVLGIVVGVGLGILICAGMLTEFLRHPFGLGK